MNAFNLYLTKLIDRKYQLTPFYGVPRMTDYLNGLGIGPINHKRVENLYKIMDIRAIGPNPNTSKSDARKYKYPYLLRDLPINHTNLCLGCRYYLHRIALVIHVFICHYGFIFEVDTVLGYIKLNACSLVQVRPWRSIAIFSYTRNSQHRPRHTIHL